VFAARRAVQVLQVKRRKPKSLERAAGRKDTEIGVPVRGFEDGVADIFGCDITAVVGSSNEQLC